MMPAMTFEGAPLPLLNTRGFHWAGGRLLKPPKQLANSCLPHVSSRSARCNMTALNSGAAFFSELLRRGYHRGCWSRCARCCCLKLLWDTKNICYCHRLLLQHCGMDKRLKLVFTHKSWCYE